MSQSQDIISNFKCSLCQNVVNIPMENSCCGLLYCKKCIPQLLQKNNMCSCCQSKLLFRESMVVKRMMKKIIIECLNKCGQTILLERFLEHQSNCPLKKIICKFCKQQIGFKDISKHTQQSHQDQFNKFITQIHKNVQQKSQIRQSKIIPTKTIKPSITQKNNENGNKAYIGMNGKYYCRGKIKLKDQTVECGTDINCQKCMKLDVRNLQLPKGYLTNIAGFICQYKPQFEACFCGRNITVSRFSDAYKSCKDISPCSDCTKINMLIKYGFYKQLL